MIASSIFHIARNGDVSLMANDKVILMGITILLAMIALGVWASRP